MKKLIVAAGLAAAAAFALPGPAEACPGSAKESQAQQGKQKGKQTVDKQNVRKPRTTKS